MELNELQQHVKVLATLSENASPIISCYLDLQKGRYHYTAYLEKRLSLLNKTLSGQALTDFQNAWEKVYGFIENGLFSDSKGAAIFARSGKEPFFLPLQFRAALPDWLSVDKTPNIYHLIEMKDNYHRFVIVISQEESGRIFEVNLGAVTEAVWKDRPELRKRVGREWTREHYQNHRRDRTQKFIKEKVNLLDQLMSAGGYAHLILAGNDRTVAQLKSELPNHLAEKVIDTVTIASSSKLSDIVEKALNVFIEQEQHESLAAVDQIVTRIRTDGLAVVGAEETQRALEMGQADMLVTDSTFDDVAVREKLVRLAMNSGCKIETVTGDSALSNSGGVGCLLRYRIS